MEESEVEGEEGVVRRYLMQDSKINSTAKIGISMRQVEGERNFVAPTLKSAPVFGGIAGIMKGETGDNGDDIGSEFTSFFHPSVYFTMRKWNPECNSNDSKKICHNFKNPPINPICTTCIDAPSQPLGRVPLAKCPQMNASKIYSPEEMAGNAIRVPIQLPISITTTIETYETRLGLSMMIGS